jgi:hypothetical protein
MTRWSSLLRRGDWRAYRDLLRCAHDHGYLVLGIDDWFHTPPSPDRRCLIIRHDVDQQPGCALRMAAIESDLGVRSTWYLRWRTAHPRVVAELASQGAVGLHYETLTRAVLANGVAMPDRDLVERCREVLREEVTAFSKRFGPIRSICPHGDSRVPSVRNNVLVQGCQPQELGVAFDGDEVMRGRPLGAWLTDRAHPLGWKDGVRPEELLRQGASPLFAVVHPNNWSARLSTVADRTLRAALPHPERLPWPLRSGPDQPPL